MNVLNSTVFNEHELLVQFESIVNAKENQYDVKDCVVQQFTFKEIFYQQHLIQTFVERTYVLAYRYGWNLRNYDENQDILIPANGIQKGIQMVLKCVYLKKQTSYVVHYMNIRKDLNKNSGVNVTYWRRCYRHNLDKDMKISLFKLS